MPENRYKKAMDELRLSDDLKRKHRRRWRGACGREGRAGPAGKARGLRAGLHGRRVARFSRWR
jgi:hypothetical protein